MIFSDSVIELRAKREKVEEKLLVLENTKGYHSVEEVLEYHALLHERARLSAVITHEVRKQLKATKPKSLQEITRLKRAAPISG